jgi:hypothetical protein
MSQPSVMDVYEMLCIKPTSTIQEVRKAYKTMALYCHPDKGGNPNDMRILQSSYEWICKQLSQVQLEADKGTYEEREAEFKEFLKAQESVPLPSFYSIDIETLDIPEHILTDLRSVAKESFPHDNFCQNLTLRNLIKFYTENGEVTEQSIKDVVEDIKNKIIPSSIKDGYGEYLLPSHHSLMESQDLQNKEITSFNSQSIILKPCTELGVFMNKELFMNIDVPNKLVDYSSGKMCDYKVAYSETVESFEQLEKTMDEKGQFTKTLDTVIETRTLLDEELKSKIPEQIILGSRDYLRNLRGGF